MSLYEMAVNIMNSDMDVNLKKMEIGKLRNQAYSNKFTANGLTFGCILFGITIIPLFLLPLTIKAASLNKQQIMQIDKLLKDFETAK